MEVPDLSASGGLVQNSGIEKILREPLYATPDHIQNPHKTLRPFAPDRACDHCRGGVVCDCLWAG